MNYNLMYIAALLATFGITVLISRKLIPILKSRKMGQTILEIGPRWHKNKEGTPTMGGLAFILAVVAVGVAACIYLSVIDGIRSTLPFMFTLAFAVVAGLIGCVDDTAKLRKKQNEGLTAPQKFLLQLIAENITANVRQIEGTVKKIMAYRDLNNMPLDLPNISRAIDDMFKAEGNALPTPSLIISQVCKFYSVDETVLRGTLKNKGTAEARQTAMYLIRKLTNLSLPDIGKEFARDHSTVLYAIRKVETQLKKGDETLQNNIRDITANINSCL